MKEKDIHTIWQVPKYLPYVQPGLTDDVVSKAEKHIGFKLPKSYLEILKIQNGGYIRFSLKDIPHSQIYGIGPYYPSVTDFEWLSEYDHASFDTKGLFPFDGDGHWNLCLDYRTNTLDPQITYIDLESDMEKLIATSFNNYLLMLEIVTDNEFVIDSKVNIDTILKQISEAVQIQFEEPDYFSHGYPVFRSNFKDSWIWISPNKVSGGFIREQDERYTELKSQMETTALRYPELPESALLISTSEDTLRKELFSKLATVGIDIRDLKHYIY